MAEFIEPYHACAWKWLPAEPFSAAGIQFALTSELLYQKGVGGLERQTQEEEMIDHTGIGVADVARSAAFYDAALGALGMRRVVQLPAGEGTDGIGYGVDYPVFWIDRFHPHGTRQHTAFVAKTRAAVDAFHAAALKAGGTDNGKPGLRDRAKGYPPGYYAAFILDPEGNNMEAVCRNG